MNEEKLDIMDEEDRAMWIKRILARQETIAKLLETKLETSLLFSVIRTEEGLIRFLGVDGSDFHLGREQIMQLREIISGPPLLLEERTVKEEKGTFKVTSTHIEKVYHSLQETWQRIINELDDEVNNIQDCVGEYQFHWTHPLDEEAMQVLGKGDREYTLMKSGGIIILSGMESDEDEFKEESQK